MQMFDSRFKNHGKESKSRSESKREDSRGGVGAFYRAVLVKSGEC